MKIVFLCKRRPMGRDLYTRPYGRFFYLPHRLAQQGHTIFLLLLSHKVEPSIIDKKFTINWICESIYNGGLLRYLSKAIELCRKSDWVVGCSDTYYGILSAFLGRNCGIKSVIDAYDNYESYIPWCKPLHLCWQKAISQARVVTAAGPHLADYLRNFRHSEGVHVIPMAADPTGFGPLDRTSCRHILHLPKEKKLVGYCGSINRNRGIKVVFDAFENLNKSNKEIEIVLCGRIGRGVQIPRNVRWLGYVPDRAVPYVLNSMDVLLVANELSQFGKFSYPVKLYEAMQCQIPVVATDTAPSNWILGGRKQFLARPGDYMDVAEKVKDLLFQDRFNYGEQPTWEQSARMFEQALTLNM